MTRSSQRSFPSSTREARVAAPNAFEQEPMLNSVPPSTGVGFPNSRTP